MKLEFENSRFVYQNRCYLCKNIFLTKRDQGKNEMFMLCDVCKKRVMNEGEE